MNPGNPVGYGVGAYPGNMKGATYCCGSPGRVMLQIGSMEMGKRFYHLPSRTIPYSTDALNCDIQCGIESYEALWQTFSPMQITSCLRSERWMAL